MAGRTIECAAITGGTGFVGGRLIDFYLENGVAVRALARSPKKLAKWADKIEIIPGDLDNHDALRKLSDGADAFIHCAGLTHALSAEEFHAANVTGAVNAAKAAIDAGAFFVHMSSMAARRPELSDYAGSKAKSEEALQSTFPEGEWAALRAPAIYGPGDMATLPYFRMVKSGIAPEPATKEPARASILFVDDVVAAIASAARNAQTGEVYEVGDDKENGHTWTEIGIALGSVFDKKPFRLRAPRAGLMLQASVAEFFAQARRKATFVTRGKVREFFHPDWVARDNLLCEAVAWRAQTPLEEGFAKTLRWYQEEGYL